jgi:DMSO/TMAO reductase YedYZ molybdopterin-dependent catalytic subunit
MSAPESERLLLRKTKPHLRVVEDGALNAEAVPELLDDALTPVGALFVRNNGRLPQVDHTTWTLTVDGEVAKPRTWSLAELKATFDVVNEVAVMECAGNGRTGFVPPTDGAQWSHGAVGCARWTGVRMRDLLLASGLKYSAVYTGHYSPDVKTDGSGKPALSRGLPIAKAMAPETLIAFEMNGAPLPLLHGAPLRVVAPGFPGSAWQKWLSRIRLRDREHDGEKMTGTDYRLPRRPVAPGQKPNPSDFAVIVDMPVKSLITSPAANATLRAGEEAELRGFAWSGHVPVTSVSVSVDAGKTWQPAALDPASERFAWRRFRVSFVPEHGGPLVLMARSSRSSPRRGIRAATATTRSTG